MSSAKATIRELAIIYLAGGPRVAWMIGEHLWPDRKGAIVAAKGGGDYAAQMLMGRMRKAGIVRARKMNVGATELEITDKGRELAIQILRRLAFDANQA